MRLFHIQQNINLGYDTYDSAVVAAQDKKMAKRMVPAFQGFEWIEDIANARSHGWAYPKDVQAKEISTIYNKPALVVASFNAG